MKKLIALIMLILALALPTLGGCAAPEPLDITDAFAWHVSEGEEVDPDTLTGNAAYLELLRSLAVDVDAVCEGAALRLTARQALATDDMTALTWQVTNTSDRPLYVRSNEFMATFGDIEYDLCSGMNWKNYLIRPGETLNARFTGVLWEHCEPGASAFTLNMTVYEIAAAAIPEDYYTDENGLYPGGEFFPEDEDMLSQIEELTFTVPMTMGVSEMRTALTDGQPLERDCGRYVLRVTRADMNAAYTEIEYERIYPSEADARADSPTGSSFWDYDFRSGDGSKWIRAGFGDIPDDPVELDDGRWSWRIHYKVYFMFNQPASIVMHPRYFEEGTGYLPADDSEDLVLDFTAASARASALGERRFGWDYGFVRL